MSIKVKRSFTYPIKLFFALTDFPISTQKVNRYESEFQNQNKQETHKPQ